MTARLPQVEEVGVSQLNDFVSTHLGAVGLVIILGCVVLLLIIGMLFIQSSRIALLSQRLDALTQGVDGESLEGVLDTHLETVMRVSRDLDEVQARTAVLEGNSRLHFSRLGLVRFNPFDDTGGNQSFALAMLDSNNDGYVVTSLHSRSGTRLYAKAVFGGEAESTLGEEEAKAVEIAVSQGGVMSGATGAAVAAQGRRTGARASGRAKQLAPVLPREAVPPSAPREAAAHAAKDEARAEAAAVEQSAAPKPDAAPRQAAAPKPARSSKAAARAASGEVEAAVDEGQTSPSA
jgi:hypothetical protein